MNARRPARGITLLELLLSVGVMAMIAVSLGTLFDTGGQVWKRVDANEAFAEHAVNRSELRRRLEAMPIVTIERPLNQIFTETNDGLTMQVVREGDPTWITIVTQQTEVYAQDGETKFTLRTDLSRATLRYFGRKTVREDPDWYNDWRGAIILPSLIKIETWAADGSAYPPLTIQLGKITRQMEISLSSLVPPD